MRHPFRLAVGLMFAAFVFTASFERVSAQIPNQLAQDLVAGRPPTTEEVAQIEKDAAAKPDDLRMTRKLGKAYFFQFFGGGEAEAVPKAQKTLERTLEIRKNDAEAMAYLGALHILRGQRLEKADAAKQKASYDLGFNLLRNAEKADPTHGAVISVASAGYLWLPDSYGMAPHVVELIEGMRKAMGPMFKKFADHGQQRLLLTLGQAYLRTNQTEKAKAAFDEGLQVNGSSREADLIKKEVAKMKP